MANTSFIKRRMQVNLTLNSGEFEGNRLGHQGHRRKAGPA